MSGILIYFLLIFISFTFCLVFKDREKKYTFLVGVGEESELRNLGLPTFFLFLLVLIACRAESIGNDTKNYHYIFDKSMDLTLSSIFFQVNDCIFFFVNYVIHQITDNYQIYLFITALWYIVPIAWYYCQDRRHSLLKIALFVDMSTFVMMFSGIRQMMAISLGVLAFCCLKHKKRILFFVLATICTFIHVSGFMVFFLFPLYYLRFKKKHLIVLIPIIGALFVFNRQFFGLLMGILVKYDSRFDVEISSIGGVTMLVVFAAFFVFSYWISDETQMDDEAFALRNMLMFAMILQCFAPLYELAMRMGYYFIIFIPATMGKILTTPKKSLKNIARVGEISMIVCFTLYFFYNVYCAYTTGGMLHTVPYIPFWEE